MKVVYFILIYYICDYDAAQTNYCKFCTDHTLCKYNISGPSPACDNYDKASLLTIKHIMGIVTQINKRRNFVALGHSKFLPQAANMKKIVWSHELAKSAQRWADQCDPVLRPDKHDLCRDLGNWTVGQNIASIEGPSPGLNIKSFVELWFMQILRYKGNVAFYNQSLDYKTNDFTQLIWAETELVGCGRVKFYVHKRNNSIERLVCNFARRGNIDKGPVYVIGNPGTQCANYMMPDPIYPGLCLHGNCEKLQKSSNRLVKALQLSNQHDRQAIDPISYNLKQEDIGNSYMNNSNDPKVKKTIRHVFPNNTYGRAVKRVMPRPHNHFGEGHMNHSQSDYDYHYHNRGHSRLYHGYELPTTHSYTTINEGTIQHFRRYEYPTEPPYNMQQTSIHYRKYNTNHKCTRKGPDNCCTNNQCTRNCINYQEPATCQHETTSCQTTHCCQITDCCDNPKFYQHPQTEDPIVGENFHHSCQCARLPCATTPCCKSQVDCQLRVLHSTPCIKHRKFAEDYRGTPNSDMQYYDFESNVAVRSGAKSLHKNSPSPENEPHKIMLGESERRSNKQRKESNPKLNIEDRDLLYPSYDTSVKRKRQVEETLTLTPLWQINKLSNKNLFQAKLVRYTTLPTRKGKRGDNLNLQVNTERITVATADSENIHHVSEKYLSFDELMHLRKNNDKYLDYELRRAEKIQKPKQKPPTKKNPKVPAKTEPKSKPKPKINPKTKPEPTTANKTITATKNTTYPQKNTVVGYAADPIDTSKYTINTTFKRKKHCTRRLTCTWTLITGPGENGSGIAGGGGGGNNIFEGGSRTPPGYVEGCTRTSTCTRDFMDRNKISTVGDGDHSMDDQDGTEDEDYCEKRSLNVKRRNSDENRPVKFIKKDCSEVAAAKQDLSRDRIVQITDNETVNLSIEKDCLCDEMKKRKKRQPIIPLQLHAIRSERRKNL